MPASGSVGKRALLPLILDNTYILHRCTVGVIGYLDAGLGAGCMNNLAAADIHCHMVDGA